MRPFTLSLVLAFALLPGASAAGETPWIEVRSQHFLLRGDASLDQARSTVEAFENMREVFLRGFPALKVDPPAPLLIIAANGERSMRALVPWYWEVQGGVHPTGVFYRQPDQDFAVVRTDLWSRTDQENPSLYHEYTHSILHMNFRALPTWLDEGLAEYFGDTVFERDEVAIGKMNRWRAAFLDQSQWLPLDVLTRVDHDSPYYQEDLKASLFYAESWLLARFLLQEPEAVQQGLLQAYLQTWLDTGDPDKARAVFGDLKDLQMRMRLYLNRKIHGYQRMARIRLDAAKSFKIRTLSEADTLTAQGDFLLGVNKPLLAAPRLEAAAKASPALAGPHTGLGRVALTRKAIQTALQEFQEAERLDPAASLPALLRGRTLLQEGQIPEATVCLEKAVRLAPQSAEAQDALAHAYLATPGKVEAALTAEKRAFELDPMRLGYLAQFGRIHLAEGHLPVAKAVGAMMKKMAITKEERSLLATYLEEVAKPGKPPSTPPPA